MLKIIFTQMHVTYTEKHNKLLCIITPMIIMYVQCSVQPFMFYLIILYRLAIVKKLTMYLNNLLNKMFFCETYSWYTLFLFPLERFFPDPTNWKYWLNDRLTHQQFNIKYSPQYNYLVFNNIVCSMVISPYYK